MGKVVEFSSLQDLSVRGQWSVDESFRGCRGNRPGFGLAATEAKILDHDPE